MLLNKLLSTNKNDVKPELYASLLVCYNTAPLIYSFPSVVEVSISLFFFFFCLSYNKNKRDLLSSNSLLLSGFLLFILVFSVLVAPSSRAAVQCLLSFLCFGLPFLLTPLYKLNFDLILDFIFIIGLISLPFFLQQNYDFSFSSGGTDYESGILMSVSYRMLQYIFISFVMLLKTSNFIKRITALVSFLLYLFLFVVIASRGALIALFTFFLVYYITRTDDFTKRFKRLFISFTLLLLVFFSFENIIYYLYDVLSSNGYNIVALDRLQYTLRMANDLTSGRGDLISLALSEFYSSPIIGNGIGSFNNYNGDYPHNLFIELLQEGGVIYFIIFCSILYLGFKKVFKLSFLDPKFQFYIIIICCGFMQLLFSSFYWQSHFFWIFVAFSLNNNRYLIKKSI